MPGDDDAPIDGDERDRLLAPLTAYRVIVLAVSGGPDSTALMHLVRGWSGWRDGPASVVAVTVDHGLRAESSAEADDVAILARDLGIAHRIVRWDGPVPPSGLQAAARRARYRLLSEVAVENAAASGGPAAIVTAHTADDQAETLIMRLARGSGLDGLAAIRSHSTAPGADGAGESTACHLIRPFLSIARSRLLATLASESIPFADDPSNRDRRFERVRVREALDVLATLGVTRAALQRSARRLQAAHEVVEGAADECEARSVRSIGGLVYEIDRDVVAGAPVDTAVRVIGRMLRRAGGAAPHADLGSVEAAVLRLVAGSANRPFTLGGCIVECARLKAMSAMVVRVYREPDRDGGLPRIVLAPGETAFWDERFRVAVSQDYAGRVEVGPLDEDWATLCVAHPDLVRIGLPRAAARGIPAFRQSGRLVAVPLLSALLQGQAAEGAAGELAGSMGRSTDGAPTPVFVTIEWPRRLRGASAQR
ncbi:MAG: tRNA lysidine(34) synthetase TilS [Hyphomicrobiaceae bacterium]